MTTPGNYRKINFDRCDHRMLGTCADDTEGCCAVVACDLCLRLLDAYVTPEEYDIAIPIASGRATFSGDGYSGQVESITFLAEWLRDYETGQCKLFVEIRDPFDTQFLEFSKCYDPEADCMFPAGEQSVTFLLEGTPKAVKLVWTPLDVMTLRHRQEPYNECLLPACGDCTCSTRELCLTLSGTDGCIEALLVKATRVDEDCLLEELPEWDYSFTCNYKVISGSLRMEHNEVTGYCELIHEIASEYLEQVVILAECKTIDETFVWSMGEDNVEYSLRVRSADCEDCINDDLLCCDCRAFADTTVLGVSNSPDDGCAAETVENSGLATGEVTLRALPFDKQRWLETDCILPWPVRWVVSPSPTCDEIYGNGYVVFVQRGTFSETTHPNVNSDIVEKCEWYMVLYTDGPDGLYPMGLSYEYSQCCVDLPQINPDVLLKRLTFPSVDSQYGNWSFVLESSVKNLSSSLNDEDFC